jgi:hypothetical protein
MLNLYQNATSRLEIAFLNVNCARSAPTTKKNDATMAVHRFLAAMHLIPLNSTLYILLLYVGMHSKCTLM